MGKVIELRRGDTELIDFLDDIREKAVEGDIIGIAVIALCSGEKKPVLTGWSEECSQDLFRLAGATEALKFRAIRAAFSEG